MELLTNELPAESYLRKKKPGVTRFLIDAFGVFFKFYRAG
jgi:hypothetical protein